MHILYRIVFNTCLGRTFYGRSLRRLGVVRLTPYFTRRVEGEKLEKKFLAKKIIWGA